MGLSEPLARRMNILLPEVIVSLNAYTSLR